jgi:hypothetical protein
MSRLANQYRARERFCRERVSYSSDSRRSSGSSLDLPEHGSQSRYKRDNRHYIAHQCDLLRGLAAMPNFALFI